MGFVILSACIQKANKTENRARMVELTAALKERGFNPTSVKGCYKGVEESALVVNSESIGCLLKHARYWNQESILHVDDDLNAWLFPTEGGTCESLLGRWTEVAESVAKEFNAWTYDGVTERYFICR